MCVPIDAVPYNERHGEIERLGSVVVVNLHEHFARLSQQAIERKHKRRMFEPHSNVAVVSAEYENIETSLRKLCDNAIGRRCVGSGDGLAHDGDRVAARPVESDV
jgi:hypothetical protein